MQQFANGDSKWDLLKKILLNVLELWTGAGAAFGQILSQLGPSQPGEFRTSPDITVLVAGTAVQGLDIPCRRGALLVARLGNVGSVYAGDQSVSNDGGGQRGTELTQAGMPSIMFYVSNVNQIWVNGDNAGDRVGINVF